MTDEARGPELPWPFDVAVFGPLGVVANLFDPKPTPGPACVDRGRHEIDVLLERAERALQTAHGTGRLAVAFGVPMLQRSLAAKIATVRGETGTGATVVDTTPGAQWPEAHAPFATPEAKTTGQESGSTPGPDELPIPGYDTLSASQVVERLEGLTTNELRCVGDYESAHRRRRTILGKIDQLVGAE